MRKHFYLFLFFVVPASLVCQELVTAAGTFNDLHFAATPENKDPSLDRNVAFRKKHRIKSIARKSIIPGTSYSDSLIRLNPAKNFDEAHTSLTHYFFYTSDGLLSACATTPLNIRLSKKDSAEHRFVKVKTDSAKKEYTIEHFYKNELLKKDCYVSGLLKKTETFNDRHYLTFYDENKKQRDTSYACTTFIMYDYDEKGRLAKRTYNNTEYLFTTSPCNNVESETYAYKTDTRIITKTPFKNKEYTTDKYVNVIQFDKNGQIRRSTFCLDGPDDPWVVYSCKYDKHRQLTAVYESWNTKKPFSSEKARYINSYDKKGGLVSTSETHDGDTVTYSFDLNGVLTKIDYSGKSYHSSVIFEYSFY